ncbi:MAG: MOSC domain-containing protein [Caulobacterales bacterium]
MPGIAGTVSMLRRHPVKGFTPEALESVILKAGAHFPCDRMYAVEDGPSGFNFMKPAHVSKQKFTVLAKIAEVAKVHTKYDDDSGVLIVEAEGYPPFIARLTEDSGQKAFASWLSRFLGDLASGPLRVLTAPQGHRFMDHPQGFVSIINLASVRDLEMRTERAIDPMRFRANVYVDGWPAWAELEMAGRSLQLGGAKAKGVKAIVRCSATSVDPWTGEIDSDLPGDLFDHYNHMHCGLYVSVEQSGTLKIGDTVTA